MQINAWLIDYATIFSEQTANPVYEISFLSEEMPYAWASVYKKLSPQPANIHRIKIGTYEYLFDFSSELVALGKIKADDMVEDRLVAVHGTTQPAKSKRKDGILQRQPLGPIEYIEPHQRARYDRGHFIAHTLGGDLNINIFPQVTEINRGWSTDGKVYRSMERYCQKNPATYCFSRPLYSGQSGHPFAIEFGVLRTDGTLWANVFPNCQSEEEMARIEGLFREEITKRLFG